jgi:hypothetical protein
MKKSASGAPVTRMNPSAPTPRCRSPLFGECRDALRDEVGVEPQARPPALAEPDRAELPRVLVHPRALDAPPLRDLGRAQQTAMRGLGRLEAGREQLRDPGGDLLDGLRVEPHSRALLRRSGARRSLV